MAAGSDVATNASGTSTAATLSPGKQYRWYVYACNSSGCSSSSALYYIFGRLSRPWRGICHVTAIAIACLQF